MGKIQFTNIIVDDFSQAKKNPYNRYVHFLTHIHTDHLKGLNSSWNYGTIYTSDITKKLLLSKFPQLTCVKSLPLYEPINIQLNGELNVCVTLFDANHIKGSVMILFDGYMGRVLYSGDFRFNKQIFSTYHQLYSVNNLKNSLKCNKHIDVLYLDNTFLEDRFTFPPQDQGLKMIDDYIEKCLNENKRRIYIGTDIYGKEEVLAHIAQKFNTLIVVNQWKYEIILYMGYNCQLFTTNTEEGFIEVVKKPEIYSIMKKQTNKDCAGLVMTGWNNQCKYKGNVYYAPYSSHSNFHQIQEFVKSIMPSEIIPIVTSQNDNKDEDPDNVYGNINYTKQLNNLREKFTSLDTLERTRLKQDSELQKSIMTKLALDRPTEVINKVELGLNTKTRQTSRRGAKITNQRDQTEINKLKSKLVKFKAHSKKVAMKNIFKNMEITQSYQQEVVNIQSSSSEQEFQDDQEEGFQQKQSLDKQYQNTQKKKKIDSIVIDEDIQFTQPSRPKAIQEYKPQKILNSNQLIQSINSINIKKQPNSQQMQELYQFLQQSYRKHRNF